MDSIRVSEAPDPSSILGEATKKSNQYYWLLFYLIKILALRLNGKIKVTKYCYFARLGLRYKVPTLRSINVLFKICDLLSTFNLCIIGNNIKKHLQTHTTGAGNR